MPNTKANLLYILEGEIATTRILERMLLHLAEYGIAFTKVFVGSVKLEELASESTPFFVRAADPLNKNYIDYLNWHKKPFIYYIDDDFWSLSGDTPLANYYRTPAVRETLDYFVRSAALVVVNSEVLAAVVRKLNPNVVIANPFFDFALLEGVTPSSHDEIRIGFAGSASRGGDFEVLIPAILKVLEEYSGRVVFEFAGYLPPSLVDRDGVVFFPPMEDYNAFVAWQYSRGWDIALAPLSPSVSNLSKTNNKYREYGACGVAAIYSDYGPYATSVQHGVTGLLVGWDSEEWYHGLKRLIEDAELRVSIAEASRYDVMTRFSLMAVSRQWEKLLLSVKSMQIVGFKRHKYKINYCLDLIRSKIIRVKINYDQGGIKQVAKRIVEKVLKYFS